MSDLRAAWACAAHLPRHLVSPNEALTLACLRSSFSRSLDCLTPEFAAGRAGEAPQLTVSSGSIRPAAPCTRRLLSTRGSRRAAHSRPAPRVRHPARRRRPRRCRCRPPHGHTTPTNPHTMPSTENLYSHPQRSALAATAALGARSTARGPRHARSASDPAGAVHARSSSLTNLGAAARAKLQGLAHSQFVRYLEDNDAQDKDENDIYRAHNGQNVRRGCWRWRARRERSGLLPSFCRQRRPLPAAAASQRHPLFRPAPHLLRSPRTRCSPLSAGPSTATACATPSTWPTCSPRACSASCWAPCCRSWQSR